MGMPVIGGAMFGCRVWGAFKAAGWYLGSNGATLYSKAPSNGDEREQPQFYELDHSDVRGDATQPLPSLTYRSRYGRRASPGLAPTAVRRALPATRTGPTATPRQSPQAAQTLPVHRSLPQIIHPRANAPQVHASLVKSMPRLGRVASQSPSPLPARWDMHAWLSSG
jgi:hypothetical protein